MTKNSKSKLDWWTRGIKRYFQDCARELVHLILAAFGGEFIDPENWTIRSIERRDKGLLLAEGKRREELGLPGRIA